jgi:hypothetical protein
MFLYHVCIDCSMLRTYTAHNVCSPCENFSAVLPTPARSTGDTAAMLGCFPAGLGVSRNGLLPEPSKSSSDTTSPLGETMCESAAPPGVPGMSRLSPAILDETRAGDRGRSVASSALRPKSCSSSEYNATHFTTCRIA